MHVKKPYGRHRSFRILSGKPQTTLKHEELDAINGEFLAGRLTLERAHEQVKLLVKRLTPKKPVSWLPENGRLAQAYWEARIKPKRSNVAPWEAKRRIFWAVSQVGATPLLSSTEEDLYKAMSHLKPAAKKRCAAVLNALLRWKGLEKFIQVERVVRPEPRYLTLEEIESFSLPKLPWDLCARAAFGTGARYGELFAMNEMSLREEGSHILILHQMKKDGGLHEIKNRKTGTSLIIKELREAVRAWCAVPVEVKQQMRSRGLPGDEFRLAAFKTLKRHLTFHNLRHSYARCMLTRNEGLWEDRDAATLEDLRKWMRDRMSTIEHYYTSWVVTSSQMRSDLRRFG